jgi:hypothetical protein
LRASTRALAVLAALPLIAGCGGGRHPIAGSDLASLVLQRADVGAPFSAFYVGPQSRLDTQGTMRANASRYGRTAGWIARYRRAGSTATRGPLVVESRADLFRDSKGAATDLAAYEAELTRTPASHVKRLSLSSLGDAAVGVTFVQLSAKPLRFFRIAWRDRNATASITVEGFDGRVSLPQALALARRQEVRIVAK